MAEEIDNPESLTPVQRQYAEIGDAIGRKIIDAGKYTAEQIDAALSGKSMPSADFTRRIKGAASRYSEPRGAVPKSTAASPDLQNRDRTPEKDTGPTPNAGWLQIDPGRNQQAVSAAGKAAIGLSDIQQRAMAYGLQIPTWVNTLTSVAKVASAVMGDAHTYGSRLRERAESATAAGPMFGAPTDAPGAMLSPLDTPAKRIPEIQMEYDGPKTVAQMAGPGLSPGLTQTTAAGPEKGGNAEESLILAINRLSEKIDKLTEAQDGGGEEETTENKKKTLWNEVSDAITTTPKPPPSGPIFVGGGGTPTRPHQQSAASSLGAIGEIGAFIARFI